jgi:hypothetical protein
MRKITICLVETSADLEGTKKKISDLENRIFELEEQAEEAYEKGNDSKSDKLYAKVDELTKKLEALKLKYPEAVEVVVDKGEDKKAPSAKQLAKQKENKVKLKEVNKTVSAEYTKWKAVEKKYKPVITEGQKTRAALDKQILKEKDPKAKAKLEKQRDTNSKKFHTMIIKKKKEILPIAIKWREARVEALLILISDKENTLRKSFQNDLKFEKMKIKEYQDWLATEGK